MNGALARLFLLVSFCLTSIVAVALEIPPHTSLVIDQAHLLSPRDEQYLQGALTNFQNTYGSQIQLLTIPSLENESIEEFSIRVVDKWQLGKKGKDDGILFLIAVQEHRMRIEVGRGLEGVLPDVVAGRIIDRVVKPYFKDGQYSDGIKSGLNAIATTIGGPLEGFQKPHRQKDQPPFSFILFSVIAILVFFFMFIYPFLRIAQYLGRGQGSGWSSGGRNWGSGNWGGGGFGGGSSSGGFGSGGFSGGGGGGFSGGGASGDW